MECNQTECALSFHFAPGVQQIVALVYPDRIKFYLLMKLTANGGSMAILYLLTRTNDILAIAPEVSDPWISAETLRNINMTLHYAMLFSALARSGGMF